MAVLQVNAYMRGTPLVASVVEEHEVAFFQFAFAHLAAIFGTLAVGTSLQVFVVDCPVDIAG